MGLKRTGLPAHVQDAMDGAKHHQACELLVPTRNTSGVIEMTLPYPPSANSYWRSRVITPRGGRPFVSTYVSAEGVAFKKLTALQLKAAGITPILGLVNVELCFYRPRKIGDIDNPIKPMLDALKGLAFADDKVVKRLVVDIEDDKFNPRTTVRVVQRSADLFGGVGQ